MDANHPLRANQVAILREIAEAGELPTSKLDPKALNRLMHRGLAKSVRKGVWQLTDAGREFINGSKGN